MTPTLGDPVTGDPLPEAQSPPPLDVPSTLIVERDGRPEGVALGRGEVTAVEAGTVASVGWERPAIRAHTGTGPIVLTFDTPAARDAAAAAIIAEAGLDAGAPPGPGIVEDGTTEPQEGPWTPGS